MPRQNSDFRAGVEAAAKWLTGQRIPNSGMATGRLMGEEMIKAIADDPEGTEARTVAQIVRYMRETAFGVNKYAARRAIERMANDIENFDWKRA